MKNNTIDIFHLKRADISVGDFQDLVAVLEIATAHLILPVEATDALARLRKAAKG